MSNRAAAKNATEAKVVSESCDETTTLGLVAMHRLIQEERIDDEVFINSIYATKKVPKDFSIEGIVEILELAGGVEQLIEIFCSSGKKYDYDLTIGPYCDSLKVDIRLARAFHS